MPSCSSSQWCHWIFVNQVVRETPNQSWGGKAVTFIKMTLKAHSAMIGEYTSQKYVFDWTFFCIFSSSLLTCVFCWVVTIAKRSLVWAQRELLHWSRSTAPLRMWFYMSTERYYGHLFLVIHCFTKDNGHSTLKWYSHLLPSRRILCHISGNTKKHGRYSWMHHSLKLLNSSGLSQMKKA